MTYANFMTSLRLDQAKDSLSDMDKDRFTQWLNEALTDAWTTPEWIIWPWLVDVKTKTLASYVTPLSGLNDSAAWTVWTEDPRAAFSQGKAINYLQLRAMADGTNLRVQSASATSEVVIVVRQTQPVFTNPYSGSDVIPDEFVPWIKADIRWKLMFYGTASQSEGIEAKVLQQKDREWEKLLNLADVSWRSAPWLSTLSQPPII